MAAVAVEERRDPRPELRSLDRIEADPVDQWCRVRCRRVAANGVRLEHAGSHVTGSCPPEHVRRSGAPYRSTTPEPAPRSRRTSARARPRAKFPAPSRGPRGAACCRSCVRARPAARRRALDDLDAGDRSDHVGQLVDGDHAVLAEVERLGVVRPHQPVDPRRSRRCSRTSASARRRPRSRSPVAGQLGRRRPCGRAPPAPSRGRPSRCRAARRCCGSGRCGSRGRSPRGSACTAAR